MFGLYESVEEVLEALIQRGCLVDRGNLVGTMNDKGLHCPVDDRGISELKDELTPKQIATRRSSSRIKILSSNRWRDAVTQARHRLRIPINGLSQEKVRELHDRLLQCTLGAAADRPTFVDAVVLWFWGGLVREARPLAVMLSIDPAPLDGLRASFSPLDGHISPGAKNHDSERIEVAGGNPLFGLRKILDPEDVIKIDGKPINYQPAPTDRLMGHILWGLQLSPDELPSGPTIGYTWERTPDGGGRLYEEMFGFDRANASDIRELQAKFRQIKRDFRTKHLANFSGGKTWNERWRLWNRLFPDLAFPSADALRRAIAYQKTKAPKLNEGMNL